MLVEFGNHDPVHADGPETPKVVTTVEIPEFDEAFRTPKPDSGIPHNLADRGGNHYGHKVGALTVDQFKTHVVDAISYNQGVTRLPDHEALLAVWAAWPQRGRGRPAWVNVKEVDGVTPEGSAADLQAFLSEYYEVPTLEEYYKTDDPEEAHIKKELEYWTTRGGAPGEAPGGAQLPPAVATYMQDGRINNNFNDGGDSLTALGQLYGVGTGSSSTQITGESGLTASGLVNHRVYVYTTSGNVFVYGNVTANTTTTITVDQWYVPATPGGSVGANPGTPWAYAVVDGGLVSSWFAALATGGNAPVNTDHTLATNGNTEYPTAAGGLYRKICPTATDVSTSARTVTLVPVWTANGSDTGLPRTFTVVGFFASIVPGYGGAGGPMKFETTLSPTSAVISASGDQLTVTETITGS